MNAETMLNIFTPPEGMVGHSAALVAMTGTEDFLEEAMQRFTGLRPRQRSELGSVMVYLMLDGHASSSRKEVFPPGRIPGLHELHPRAVNAGSLLHAKVALLAYAESRTGPPVHLRLAVLTANFTYTSARQHLELIWLVDVPLDGTGSPEDRADVVAAGAFVETLLDQRFHREERRLALRDRRLTARLDVLLGVASSQATNRKPRFIHSLEQPLYDQIRQRFRSGINKSRNFLLCGSGFYEDAQQRAPKPSVLSKLEDLGKFSSEPYRIALAEPGAAGAVADWARTGSTDGWEIVRPYDSLQQGRRLHAKFIYAGYLRDGYASNGWLYIGSGNLSRRGILSHGGMPKGNVETGVVFEVADRLAPEDLASRLFWSQEPAEAIGKDEWVVGEEGDAPDAQPILKAPPVLHAAIQGVLTRELRLFWRDADVDGVVQRADISWVGRDWLQVSGVDAIPLEEAEKPTALRVRDGSGEWTIPVVDEAGRVGWQALRFDTYADALAALLDFPIRPAEAADDDDRDDVEGRTPTVSPSGESDDQEKRYALHSAAEFIEKVAALQAALPDSMLDDWIDHLDRMFRSSFPEPLVATWRAYRLDVFAHLQNPSLRPPKLTDEQRSRYLEVLESAARVWGLR